MCNIAENNRNKQKQKNCTSKYIGVSYNKKYWECNLYINDLHLYAIYKNEHFAGHQYNIWCLQYNLKTSNLNIIDGSLIENYIPYKKREKNIIYQKIYHLVIINI